VNTLLPSRRAKLAHRVSVIRDVVELVAILLAGIWAIYTFLYVEEIKPAGEAPRVLLNGTIERVGTRNGLTALRYKTVIRNAGTVRFYIVATAFTAVGINYAPTRTSTTEVFSGSEIFNRDARIRSRTVVRRAVNLTRFVEPHYGGGFSLDPGQELPASGIIVVRSGVYDVIQLDESIAYSKTVDHPFAIETYVNKRGVAIVQSANRDRNLASLQETIGSAMLW